MAGCVCEHQHGAGCGRVEARAQGTSHPGELLVLFLVPRHSVLVLPLSTDRLVRPLKRGATPCARQAHTLDPPGTLDPASYAATDPGVDPRSRVRAMRRSTQAVTTATPTHTLAPARRALGSVPAAARWEPAACCLTAMPSTRARSTPSSPRRHPRPPHPAARSAMAHGAAAALGRAAAGPQISSAPAARGPTPAAPRPRQRAARQQTRRPRVRLRVRPAHPAAAGSLPPRRQRQRPTLEALGAPSERQAATASGRQRRLPAVATQGASAREAALRAATASAAAAAAAQAAAPAAAPAGATSGTRLGTGTKGRAKGGAATTAAAAAPAAAASAAPAVSCVAAVVTAARVVARRQQRRRRGRTMSSRQSSRRSARRSRRRTGAARRRSASGGVRSAHAPAAASPAACLARCSARCWSVAAEEEAPATATATLQRARLAAAQAARRRSGVASADRGAERSICSLSWLPVTRDLASLGVCCTSHERQRRAVPVRRAGGRPTDAPRRTKLREARTAPRAFHHSSCGAPVYKELTDLTITAAADLHACSRFAADHHLQAARPTACGRATACSKGPHHSIHPRDRRVAGAMACSTAPAPAQGAAHTQTAPPPATPPIQPPGWLLDPGTPGAATRIVVGAFRGPGAGDAALLSARHVQLLADAGPDRMALACTHALPGATRDACALPCPTSGQVRRGVCAHADVLWWPQSPCSVAPSPAPHLNAPPTPSPTTPARTRAHPRPHRPPRAARRTC